MAAAGGSAYQAYAHILTTLHVRMALTHYSRRAQIYFFSLLVLGIELCAYQTKFLYWAKLVFRVTRLQLPAGLVIPVNQVIS